MNDLSEKEQLDELKAWWRENRAWILGGIGIGLAFIIGIRVWSGNQQAMAVAASSEYESLLEAVGADNIDDARGVADTLFGDYGDTVYADQARLAMARLYMDRGRDADAAEVLRPLADSGDEPLMLVARHRLAQILLYQDKPEEVLELIDGPVDGAFAARFNEVRGDAHFALGNIDEAAAAYNAVLNDPRGQQTVDAELVRMKLDDLPADEQADAALDAPADDEGPGPDDTDGEQE